MKMSHKWRTSGTQRYKPGDEERATARVPDMWANCYFEKYQTGLIIPTLLKNVKKLRHERKADNFRIILHLL